MTTIRDAVIQDIPLIRELAFAIWPQTYGAILSKGQLDYMMDLIYSPAALKRQMEEGDRFLVLEMNGIPEGFASFGAIEPAATFKLHKLYIRPDRQKSGFGKMLLEQVIAMVGALEGAALQLNVNRFNKARQFYERMGFRVLREEDIDIGQGYFMNDYIMQYDLVPVV